jgi:hypothetical protein
MHLLSERPTLGFFPWLLPIAVFSFAASATAQMSLDVLARDGYAALPISRPEPNTLVVRASVNGRKVSLIVDTGAGGHGLTLDANTTSVPHQPGHAATEIGRSITGRQLKFTRAIADSVIIGNAELKGVPVNVGPMRGLRKFALNSSTADGFIGADFLHTCAAIIDLHNLRLYLRPPGTGRHVIIGQALKQIGFAEVPFTIVNNGCFVDVEINGVLGIIQIDTGAAGGLIDPRFTAKANARHYGTRMRLVDVAGAEAAVKLSRLASFKIGGIAPLRTSEVLVVPFSGYAASGGKIIGLLGIDILGPNGTIIDFAQQKMYFFKAR